MGSFPKRPGAVRCRRSPAISGWMWRADFVTRYNCSRLRQRRRSKPCPLRLSPAETFNLAAISRARTRCRFANARRCATRIMASGKAGPGPSMLAELRRHSPSGLQRSASGAATRLPLSAPTGRRSIGRFRPVQALGAVPVPVYADAVADEMAYVLSHAEISFAVVQDQEQVDKLLSISDRTPKLHKIVYDEERGLRDYDHTQSSFAARCPGNGPNRTGRACRKAVSRPDRRRQRRRLRGHSLHLRHDRPSQGRDAVLPNLIRSAINANGSTASPKTRKCLPTCLSPGSATTSSPTRNK